MNTHPPVNALLDFSGKVVLVTGGGSGLGPGLAARFAEAGAQVAVHYHSSAAGAEAAVAQCAAAGGKAAAMRANLAQDGEAERLVRQTAAAFGRLDVLINNAGIYPTAGLLEMTAEQWDELIDTDLRSAFACTQAAARQMIRQGDGGAMVNITSIEAERPAASHSHYAAAKGGLLNFTRAAAYELGSHGIRVNAVAPGLIWREGIEADWPQGVAAWEQAAPLQRLGLPQDVADACLFLASPAARWITGASLTVDGGVTVRPPF
jgi:NAD(P)-dependent dehydrogenase (short-subunit alcohol dehydrogenase family)